MNTTATTAALGQSTTALTPIQRALKLVGFCKSVSEADLQDIEKITSASDAGEHNKLPTAAELGVMREGLAMHGAAAAPHEDRTGLFTPQEGRAKQAEALDAMLGSFGKAVQAITDLQKGQATLAKLLKGFVETAKAEPEEDPEDKKKKEAAKARATIVAQAFRKAKVALSKAEDGEPDEDEGEAMKAAITHAQEALKAAFEAVTKAEEEAEDDEEEKCYGKARTDLRALKGKLSALVAKSKPAAAASTASIAAVAAPTVADLAKSIEVMQGSLQSVMASVTAGAASPARFNTPPAFAKALVDQPFDDVRSRIDAADQAGRLDSPMLMKCDTILSHIAAARRGVFDPIAVAREIDEAPSLVKALFQVPTA
jgi:hypothetical protein